MRDLLVAGGGRGTRESWGRLTEAEKASFLSSLAVYVAPQTEGESFGIVLLEAMAAGAPVVASRLPAFVDVTRGGRDAELFEPGDPDDAARTIARLLDDEARRRAHASLGSCRCTPLRLVAHRVGHRSRLCRGPRVTDEDGRLTMPWVLVCVVVVAHSRRLVVCLDCHPARPDAPAARLGVGRLGPKHCCGGRRSRQTSPCRSRSIRHRLWPCSMRRSRLAKGRETTGRPNRT